MEYTSPLTLFPEIASTEQTDAAFWNTIKKKMLAEFQLNDEKPILIEGNYYSKDQILTLLENLKSNQDLAFHKLIWNDKTLLDFLTNGKIPFNAASWNALKENSDFIHFVSPYFQSKYSIALSDAFKKREVETIKHITRNLPLLVTEAETYGLYNLVQRSIYRTIKDLTDTLETIENYKFTKKPQELSEFYHIQFINCLNYLPDYFYHQRNQLAVELINLYVHAYNTLKKPNLAKEIILNASKLKVESYERSLLEERLTEIGKLQNSSNYSDSSEISGWGAVKIVFGVIWIFILLLRLCNNSSSKDYKSYNQYNSNNQIDIKSILENQRIGRRTNTDIIYGLETMNYNLQDTIQYFHKNKLIGQRPETGTKLYNYLVNEKYNAGNDTLILINKSKYDAVALLSQGNNNAQLYIRSKDSLVFTKASWYFPLKLDFYLGKKWNQHICFSAGNNSVESYCGMFEKDYSFLKDSIPSIFDNSYKNNTNPNIPKGVDIAMVNITKRVYLYNDKIEIK